MYVLCVCGALGLRSRTTLATKYDLITLLFSKLSSK